MFDFFNYFYVSMLLGTVNRVFWKFGNLILGSWDNIFFSKKHKKTTFVFFWRKSDVFHNSSVLSMISLSGKVPISDLGIFKSAKIEHFEHFWGALKRNENNLKKFPSLFIFHMNKVIEILSWGGGSTKFLCAARFLWPPGTL